ncbi:endonuclease/exonuclease/phosphatase family protein [Uliginosibacterium sp. 31-16]|uniref:endonuclease/exonuclease/phosphatase family protein n=1 Tax=Uliginosibacterium sp. 31-16 TaxID=3068315 RepID=UPI00273F2DF3|nr:endonuclease/exonuclease/phosphatase family protein [Uliginosibacterium sp. 31-16]MDP5241142.1 endonuclease/exonuclease/phosphatase family protein [Uliginosibacterium sp. 31-16]
MPTTLRICSYNIHKGFSHLNRHMAIHQMRECLRGLDPDICLLQEVQGLHHKHERRHHDWPDQPQHQFLAGTDWHSAYGANAAYEHGHHGNAVLSRFPIQRTRNRDVSLSRLEKRGILHCEVRLPDGEELHCLCVHLSLTERQRQRQLELLSEYVEHHVPRRAPLIIAGDFNDWRVRANDWLPLRLGLTEAFTELTGAPARSYPSSLPVLRLDRIYLRGMVARMVAVHWGKPWSGVSDHALLSVQVSLP